MDFDMTEVSQDAPLVEVENGELIPNVPYGTGGQVLSQENIGKMFDTARDILSIIKAREDHTHEINKLEQLRKALLDQAEAYVIKKRADTNSTISLMEQLRTALREFYNSHPDNMSGEDYSAVIGEITNAFVQLSQQEPNGD